MNAVWIALIAVFCALIPVLILAARASQKKTEANNADGGSGAETAFIPMAIGGVHAKSSHHGDSADSGSDGGGDAGGGGD